MLVDFFEKLNADRPINVANRWKKSAEICTEWLLQTIKDSPAKENALIVGAGRADDFNLPAIVEQFKRVYLLDIDPISLSIALEKLTEPQKNKVTLLPCDVTGLADRMNQLIEEMSHEQPPSVIRSIELFRDKLPKTFKPVFPNSLPKFDWVFSDCISTQLLVPVLDQFNTYAKDIPDEDGIKIMKLIGNTIDRMLVPYLRLLHNLLIKNGILAFCTDMVEINSVTRKIIKNVTGLAPELLVLHPQKITSLRSSGITMHGYNAMHAIKKSKIKFKQYDYLRFWIWDFLDSKQYLVIATHFCKY